MAIAGASSDGSNQFIKQLVSSDRTSRDRALSSLNTYLRRSTRFSDVELLKLWKGLFFSMWMCDKPLNQQRLARDLAGLLNVLDGRENILGFLRAFWLTMAREWSGIDALRMDKYLYLVRCYLSKAFEMMQGQKWSDEAFLRDYLSILEDTPLSPRDMKIPNGIRFHTIDVYVDELDKMDTDRVAPIELLLEPMRRLGSETETKAVRLRVTEALQDDRLPEWRHPGSETNVMAAGEAPDSQINQEEHAEDDMEEFAGFDD